MSNLAFELPQVGQGKGSPRCDIMIPFSYGAASKTAPVDLSCLLGFPAGLGVGPLRIFDPGVGFAEQFGHRQTVVAIE